MKELLTIVHINDFCIWQYFSCSVTYVGEERVHMDTHSHTTLRGVKHSPMNHPGNIIIEYLNSVTLSPGHKHGQRPTLFSGLPTTLLHHCYGQCETWCVCSLKCTYVTSKVCPPSTISVCVWQQLMCKHHVHERFIGHPLLHHSALHSLVNCNVLYLCYSPATTSPMIHDGAPSSFCRNKRHSLGE